MMRKVNNQMNMSEQTLTPITGNYFRKITAWKSIKTLSILVIQLAMFFVFDASTSGADETLKTQNEKKGGVCFTFDDRHFDNWIKMLPVFDKYNVKVTFFINGKLDPKQIEKVKKLQSHGHAIGCHGLKHLRAVDYCRIHGVNKYMQDEIDSQLKMFRKAGIKVTSFAYPYSCRNAVTDKELLKLFRHLRSGGFIKKDENIADKDVFFTASTNIDKQGCLFAKGIDSISFDQMANALERISQKDEIIVFYAHDISATGKGHHINPAFLERIIKKAQALNLSFYSFDQLP